MIPCVVTVTGTDKGVCPKSDIVQEERTMKKLMAMAMAGMMVLSMAACGGSSTDTTAAAADTTAAAADTTAAAASEAGSTAAATAGTDDAQAVVTAKTVSDGKLIVATEAGFAPYEYMVGDQVVGVDMDIAQAIADKLGVELEIQNMDFDACIPAVAGGKVDIVAAGLSVDPERAEQVDFSTNYVDSTEVVVVNAAAPAVTEATGEALAGKVVGVQQGNIADLWVSNADNTVPGEVMRYTKFAQAGEDLKNSKIDCIVMDELPAKELVASSNGALTILEGDPLFVDQYAIAVQKGNSEMLDVVNSVIKELQDNGKMDEIIASHSQAK